MRKLKDIMSKVLGVGKDEITDTSSPDTIESWDSFNGLVLIAELENKFKIKFTANEIINMRKVEDIKKALIKHGVKPEKL